MNKCVLWGICLGLVFGCLNFCNFFHFKSFHLLSLTVSPCLLACITDNLHNHCRGALLTTGLHLAHSPKNSLLSQSALTLQCALDQCTIHSSCISISFGAGCLKTEGGSVYASFRASCQISCLQAGSPNERILGKVTGESVLMFYSQFMSKFWHPKCNPFSDSALLSTGCEL